MRSNPAWQRRLWLLPLLLLGGGVLAVARPVFRQSWTVQDPRFDLQQEIARMVIMRANDYLTRNDPNVPTARLDDLLRVTIVGELRSEGSVAPRLDRLVMGSVVIDTSFEQFLEAPVIDRLIRRDYYWRDDTLEVFNPLLSPIGRLGVATGPPERRPEQVPALEASFERVAVRAGGGRRLFAALGLDEAGMPGVGYGRLRVGLASGPFSVWGEAPLPVGNPEGGLLERRARAAYGAGLALETEAFGGLLSGALASADESVSMPSIAAFGAAYGLLPVGISDADDIRLDVRLGMGGWMIRPADEAGEIEGHPIVYAGIGGTLLDDEGRRRGRVDLRFIGTGISGTVELSLTREIGLRLSGAANGLFGEQPSWLPAYAVILSPTFTLW